MRKNKNNSIFNFFCFLLILMENDSNNQNSLLFIQSIDKSNKYNLPSNNTSSMNQLNSTTFTGNNLKKTNVRNKSSIFGSFFKKEEIQNKRNLKRLSILKKNFDKDIVNKYGPKFLHKNSKKKINAFEPKKMINPQYLVDLLEDVEKKTPEGQTIDKINKIHFIVSIFIILSLIFCLIDNILNKEYSYKYLKKSLLVDNNYINAIKQLKNRKLTLFENFCRTISIITAFLMTFLLLIKEYLVHKYQIKIQSSRKRLIIGIVCALCFPPKINPIIIIHQQFCVYPLYLVDIYFLLNVSKLYIINFLNIGYTKYGTLLTQSICKNYSVKPGYFFSIRARLMDNPFLYSLFMLILTITIVVFLLRTFEFGCFLIYKTKEENVELNFMSPLNVIWLISIISFGVSFGDYYPKTIITRIITFFVIIILYVIAGFLLNNLMKYTIMSESEKKVFIKMTKLYSEENLEYKATYVILQILKLRRDKMLLNAQENQYIRVSYCKKVSINILILNRHIKNFQNNDKVADVFTIPVDDLLISLENKIHENLLNFEKSFDKLESIQNYLEEIQKLQLLINSNIRENITQQKSIGKYMVEINNLGLVNQLKTKIFKKKTFMRFSEDLSLNDAILIKHVSETLNSSILKNRKKIKSNFQQKKKRKRIAIINTKITEKEGDDENLLLSSQRGKLIKTNINYKRQKSKKEYSNTSKNVFSDFFNSTINKGISEMNLHKILFKKEKEE